MKTSLWNKDRTIGQKATSDISYLGSGLDLSWKVKHAI